MKKSIGLLFLCLFLYGCWGVAYNEELNGQYYLSATDTREQMYLSYEDEKYGGLGVISETVYAVGQNDAYIIAKQHPNSDKTITNYFIVPITNKISNIPEKNIFGPLTFEEFINKKKELKIENLDFSIVFEDLE